MACYRPLDGYRSAVGVSIGYERPGSTEKLLIPCGTCYGCRMEYAERWALRCRHEAQLWERNCFLTLTYDDANIPWHRSLEVRDIQLFMKRLRKAYDGHTEIPESPGRRPIRYFGAGEYGSQTGRPHWHLLLFNWHPPGYSGRGRAIELESLRDLWTLGNHEVSEFTAGRAAYTAGYAAKKVRGRIARKLRYEVYHPETGVYFEQRPEFSFMSRRPGIGIWWFQRYQRDFQRGFAIEPGGYKKRLPRVYADRLRQDPEYAYEEELRTEEWLLSQDKAEIRPERLAVREEVHRSRVGFHRKERE